VTITANTPVLVLPDASDATQDTVVVPALNLLPDEGEHSTGRLPPTTSTALAAKVTVTPDGDVVTAVTGVVGSVNFGGTLSRTLILNDTLALLPD
jgi:predicted dinucleotide-binding enzyme